MTQEVEITRGRTVQMDQEMEEDDSRLSRYPGVLWCDDHQEWYSYVQINGVRIHLGYYASEEEAFFVYRCAIDIIGETIAIFISDQTT